MDSRRAPADLRLRHHLRHQQRVRLRLPPRQHEADQASMQAQGAAPLRDHRRGRQHPDRRGPDAADHLGPGLRRRPQVRRGRPDRPAAQEGRALRGQGEGADLPPERRRASARPSRSPGSRASTPRQHGVAPPDRQLPSRPTTSTSATATTSSTQRRDRHRRRVHRPADDRPAVVRRPAPGGRGQGAGARSRKRTRRSPRSRCRTSSSSTRSSRA